MLCHHLTKFGNHCHCREYFLFCHMIKKDHAIKGSYNYSGMGFSRQVITVSSLMVIGYSRYNGFSLSRDLV